MSLGSATLFVSNVINPSEAVHCGMTKGGRLFLNPMEMTSYGSSDKLYISVEAMDRAIVHIAIMPAAVGGEYWYNVYPLMSKMHQPCVEMAWTLFTDNFLMYSIIAFV